MNRLVLFLALCASPAAAHQAASGWAYPPSCCSQNDCREFPGERMKETPRGYLFPSGLVLPYADDRIKPSPDGKFHICQNRLRVICLFVPPRGV